MTNGYFAYRTQMSFLGQQTSISEGNGDSQSRKNDRSKRINYFSSSHASHQYEPRSLKTTQVCKTKECATWTSTAGLSSSPLKIASFGRTKRSYRTHSVAITIRGVR
jgi:hypothetical protein